MKGHRRGGLTPLLGLVVVAGCVAAPAKPCPVVTRSFQTSINRQLDVLFMIDNSPSMAPLQAKLRDPVSGLPAIIDVLKKLPVAGIDVDEVGQTSLPDVHIAVISSDTGPGAFDLPGQGCRFLGDEGKFQTAARAPCAASPLPFDQGYLAAGDNQAVRNYTGDITDAFACIAALGSNGCGFQGQLKSVRWALDPQAAPPQNAGFLRTDAALAVVLVTNEDDCSLPDDSTLADPTQELVSDPLGPPSFRCNEFGHLCEVGGALQPPPRHAVDGLTGCVSNDTPGGRLTKVADEVAFLKSLKPDPSRIFVAAITGPAAPYGIQMVPRTLSGGAVEDQPEAKPSCAGSAGEYGRPSIRIQQWVQAFGSHGLILPICAGTFSPALETLATTLDDLAPACVDGTIRTRRSGAPDCVVTQRSSDVWYEGGPPGTRVSACAENGSTPPCWTLEEDPGCLGSKRLRIHGRATGTPSSNTTDISCVLASADAASASCPAR